MGLGHPDGSLRKSRLWARNLAWSGLRARDTEGGHHPRTGLERAGTGQKRLETTTNGPGPRPEDTKPGLCRFVADYVVIVKH